MSFYVEKVSRKSGACYRIVRDYTRGGERKREYQVLPQGTTKAKAGKIRCQMELEAEFGAYTTKEPVTLNNYAEEVYFPKYTNSLRWEDVTLGEKESFICVRRAAVYADGKMTEKETKTKAGTRVIPIQPEGEVYRILQTARKMYVREQSREENFQGQNHVFILHHAPFVPVSDNRMYKIYKSILEKECPDLPHYRLHDLRHTYFTLCTEIGFSELSIIATGGHSTIQSTKR